MKIYVFIVYLLNEVQWSPVDISTVSNNNVYSKLYTTYLV